VETSRDSRRSTQRVARAVPAMGKPRTSRPRCARAAARGSSGSVLEQSILHFERGSVFVGLRISFGSGGPRRTLASCSGWPDTRCSWRRRLASDSRGKLWDDLRSLLLLIVMMFLAMATSATIRWRRFAPRRLGYLAGSCLPSWSPSQCCVRSGSAPRMVSRCVLRDSRLVFLYRSLLAHVE